MSDCAFVVIDCVSAVWDGSCDVWLENYASLWNLCCAIDCAFDVTNSFS